MVDNIKKRTAIKSGSAVTRRQFMGTTAKAVAAGTVAASFPYISTGNEPLRTI
ncbi:MAG TPA: twin-arginine translocation signal domain-containing protein, partial [Gammaproteobacteria bacterium]|nr:twin-arginine translocation signal domain-containing protein [Gammaproteobacteria bacterium]HIP04245.1 twin-arginine translocation signal domain-containing protein [Gammaproteobacteria bacterium]